MPGFGWIRNPLTIIAIFISLIYGIASLLFAASVGKLTPENQSLLVYFVIGFPIAVLGVFSWLVARHHHKLYGPGDYRNDDTFARTFPTASPKEVAEKKIVETKELEAISPKSLPSSNQQQNSPAVSADARVSPYVLESLVVRELQEIGAVRREVHVGSQIVDCVIEVGSTLTLVEIRALNKNWYLFTALQQAGRLLRSAAKAAAAEGADPNIKTMAALVLWQTLPANELEKELIRLPSHERPHSVRVFYYRELLLKYQIFISPVY